jgi:hypothetical protein
VLIGVVEHCDFVKYFVTAEVKDLIRCHRRLIAMVTGRAASLRRLPEGTAQIASCRRWLDARSGAKSRARASTDVAHRHAL